MRQAAGATLDDLTPHLFVPWCIRPDMMERLKRVRERVMSDVVKEPSHQYGANVLLVQRHTHLLLLKEALQVSDDGPVHAEGMLESSMRRPWIHQIGRAQLPDTPQPLKVRMIDDLQHGRGHRNVLKLRESNNTATGTDRDKLRDRPGTV